MIKSIPKLVVGLALALAVGCASEDMMGMGAAGMPDGGGTGGSAGAATGSVGADAGTGGAVATVPDGGGLGGAPGTGGMKMDAGGGAGAGGAPAAGTGGMLGTGGAAMAMGTGGVSGAGGAPAAMPMYCPQTPGLGYVGDGYLNRDNSWTSRWKGDFACGACTYGQPVKQVVGCLIASTPGTKVEGTGPVLCVMSAVECCYKKPESACENDAGCCAPLHCQDNGGGKVKTCR